MEGSEETPHTQLDLQLCPFLVLLLLLLLYASVRNMPGSSPEALLRQTPACYFPTASALWPHKSGRDDSPRSAQDTGANKGLWLTVTTLWVSRHWDNAQVPHCIWGLASCHHVTSPFLGLFAKKSSLHFPLDQFWGGQVRESKIISLSPSSFSSFFSGTLPWGTARPGSE